MGIERQLDLYAASRKALEARLKAETRRLAAIEAGLVRIALASRPVDGQAVADAVAVLVRPTIAIDTARAASIAAGARRVVLARQRAVRRAIAELETAIEMARHRQRALSAAAAAQAGAGGASPSDQASRPSEAVDGRFAADRMLRLPVAGAVVAGFGDVDADGLRSRGLVLAAPPNAEVIAPEAGQVRYAGAFRGYGHVLIIDHGGGYHSLLAGLGRLDAPVGSAVVGGQPVGRMTDDSSRRRRLLFELWRGRAPIDPRPWVPVLTVEENG